MQTPQLSIIIPVFNQWSLTEQCLHSLRKYTPGDSFEVIVVDNGSTDETPIRCPELGRALFGACFKHIRLEYNINFGPGCNLGATRAKGTLLFFLNNDTLLTTGWLPPLVKAFASEGQLGAAGPVLLYPDSNRVQHLGLVFTPTNNVSHLFHFFPGDHSVVGRERILQAITGAALMTSRDIFERAGRFWEEYRNGYEDLDLCSRIRALGFTLRCIPQSQIYHLASKTPGRFNAEDHNSLILARRCCHSFQPDLHRFASEEGYQLRLTHLLSPNLVYVCKDLESKPFDLDRTWATVLAEPLWEAGYELLFSHFVDQNMWTNALELLKIQQCFFSSEKVVVGMALTAKRLGDWNLLAQCLATLDRLHTHSKSPEIIKKIRSIQQWAAAAQDDILAEACHNWFKVHGQVVPSSKSENDAIKNDRME